MKRLLTLLLTAVLLTAALAPAALAAEVCYPTSVVESDPPLRLRAGRLALHPDRPAPAGDPGVPGAAVQRDGGNRQ